MNRIGGEKKDKAGKKRKKTNKEKSLGVQKEIAKPLGNRRLREERQNV